MTPIPFTPEFCRLAQRIIWFERPEQALRNPVRFMAYAFRYATAADMDMLRSLLSDDDLREALANAPPGIIDPRSWSYWHAIVGQFPPPPMPERKFV